MSALFGPEFRAMLHTALRKVGHFKVRRESELRARQQVTAANGTFAGHRAYGAGEDLRYVDWNVYARTGDLFVKVLEEDERRALTIFLDCSPSMLAGEPPRYDGARRLAALFGCMALVKLDGLRLVCGANEVHVLSGAAKIETLLEILEEKVPEVATPMELVQTAVERGFQGSTCWISDFAVPEEYAHALRLLRSSGRRCTGVLAKIPDDELPPVHGWLRFFDPETGGVETLQVDARLRSAMEKELDLLRRQQNSIFKSVGSPLVRFSIPAAEDFRLASWLPGQWFYRI